jgi:hypothetical protein
VTIVYSIFDSNFLQTIAMLVVGLFTFIIWKKNRRTKVRDAASYLVTEIEQAQKKIDLLKRYVDKEDNNQRTVNFEFNILENDSWQTAKYTLKKYLDNNEWSTIDDFYQNCNLLNAAVINNRNSFYKNLEMIRQYHTEILSHGIENEMDSDMVPKNNNGTPQLKRNNHDFIQNKAEELANYVPYSPQKNFIDISKWLSNFNGNITDGIAYKTIKQIAARKKKIKV